MRKLSASGKRRAKEAKLILALFREQVREEIKKRYRTVEEFCIESDIDHSIISRFLSGQREDLKASTIYRIGKGLSKKPIITLE